MTNGLTTEELLALPDGAIVELQDCLGRTYAAAQRIGLNQSLGRSSQPGERRGWVLTEYLEVSAELATRICDESYGSHRLIELNGGERVLFDFRNWHDFLDGDYLAAGEQFIEDLRGLPEYSLISVRGGELLGLKLNTDDWATGDYSWIDDEEAIETEFVHADSIWELATYPVLTDSTTTVANS